MNFHAQTSRHFPFQSFLSILLLLLLLHSLPLSFFIQQADGFLCEPHDFYEAFFLLHNQCPLHSHIESSFFDIATISSKVSEINVHSLDKALESGGRMYTAVLFYAEWCPFSRTLRETFESLAMSFPTISHLAIESSSLWPSALSQHGVYSIPALLLYNKTKQTRYYGPRTFKSIGLFYTKLTGVFPTLVSSKTEIDTAAMSYTLDHRWKLSKSENLCLMLTVSFLLSRFLFYLWSKILVNIRHFCNKDV